MTDIKIKVPSKLVLDFIDRNITYDKDTGLIYKNGKSFGSKDRDRIKATIILDAKYEGCSLYYKTSAHQIAWYLTYGSWANMIIDHINGNPHDNRIDNLRLATSAQNNQNARKMRRKNNKPMHSLYKGISRCSPNRWRSDVRSQGKHHDLGVFLSETEAALAYDAKALALFGGFARLNFNSEKEIEEAKARAEMEKLNNPTKHLFNVHKNKN